MACARSAGSAGAAVPLVATGGHAVVLAQNRAGLQVRVTLLDAHLASGKSVATFPATVEVFNKRQKAGDLTLSQPSEWVSLETVLKDRKDQVLARLYIPGPDMDRLQARIDVADGDPGAGGRLLKTLTDSVQGNTLAFLVPGPAYPDADRAAAVELLSEHAKKYLAAARAVGLKPEERPKQFVISCTQFMGGQGHLGQLKTSAEALSLLGINTSVPYFWDNLPPAQVDGVLDSFGMRRRASAVYNPPSFFDFDQEKMSRGNLDKWAARLAAKTARDNGAKPADVVLFKLSDEPGWFFPNQLKELRDNRSGMEVFRAYLKEQGLTPSDLGGSGWEDVLPITASAATDLPSRRLFYWTMRFFSASASRGHRQAREALERSFQPGVSAPVNFNNWLSRWYIPSPNKKYGNNPVSGPDSGYGSFDWMESGRESAHTLWTEDWFGDYGAQHWSLYGDALRSAAMLGTQDFGGYVVGRRIGDFPDGAKYKILALIGHGAKTVDLYSWGPYFFSPGNTWSERFEIYRPIADALRLVGRGERLLYPGRPQRGSVALFLPSGSSLWDTDSRLPYYYYELWSLHHALMHAGYTVDFVDETDLEGDALAKRGYSTLYLTGPNVSVKAQQAVRDWVKGGGTLMVTPGAAVADQYNTPSNSLDAVIGLRSRTAVRDPAPNTSEYRRAPVTDRLTISDSAFGTGSVDLKGPVTTLQPEDAKVAAKLKGGGAGITVNAYGRGRTVATAFFPGWQYWLSPDYADTTRLPHGWSDPLRTVAVAPVRLANTPRTAFASREGVEVCRLQSAKGIALVLLNWTGDPLSSITVTVPKAGRFTRVTSVERGTVSADTSGETVKVTLPLKSVDVLMLE
jgi:hypothetical protein